jgi:predicted PurR-regulated permease PerM
MVGSMVDDLMRASQASGNKTDSPTLVALQQALGISSDGTSIKRTLSQVLLYSGKIAEILANFLLALLFSLLISLDFPRLSGSVASLRHSKLRFVYLEVMPSILQFSRLLGRAIEAQLMIAIVNSVLTAVGLAVLGLGQYLAFLTVIVFLFSFIPIAGVFISSVPICMVALQVGGPSHMLGIILLIVAIHMIETYILNPKIYGAHLHLNPVVVLVILTIGGKLFGFWGLLLGVPLCTWFFTKAIRNGQSSTHL